MFRYSMRRKKVLLLLRSWKLARQMEVCLVGKIIIMDCIMSR